MLSQIVVFSLANVQWGLQEYAHGHVPGAVYADLNRDLSAPVVAGVTGRHPLPKEKDFLDWVERSGISHTTQVVAYDQGGGGIAARLWWLMRWIGHEAVAVLNGGWPAWRHSGLDEDTAVPSPVRTAYHPVHRQDLTVKTETIQHWCHDPKHAIVDSRDARRFTGEEETIDPVAGHIPGAVNIPFMDNVNPDGTWKSPEFLRSRFAQLVKDKGCADVAFYCGSGVTACQNVLAFKHAGLGDARLYPGSWSEWITDTTRGVDVGTE